MNALFWNIRGITAPGKRICINDTLSKHNPSIISFQETKKEHLTHAFLKAISRGKKYDWHHLPAEGTSSGVLVGVDLDIFDVTSWIPLKFSDSCMLTLQKKNISFRFIAVYGSPYDEGKDDFLSELHSLFIDYHVPTIIGGLQSS